jgi:hypothetical protein
MIAPFYFREARMTASDHIQGKIVQRGPASVQVMVERVFRGKLKRGTRLTLHVSIAHGGPIELGSTLYTNADVVASARYVEAFLDGSPPEVVRDQIKFLAEPTREPSGDPTTETFRW